MSSFHELPLPRPLGPYQLVRRIAKGGMAEVYVAKAKGIGGFEKLVALKAIHARLSEDEQFVTMLVDEAKLSVLLNHANIAQTFDLGCVDGQYFIVMEYVEGVDCARLLHRAKKLRKPLPVAAAVFIAAEVCAALDYAHKKAAGDGAPLSIVHRDVSPQNVLVSTAGEVKLTDFGIAKAALRTTETEVGVIKGKYYYMSPEQAWADPMDRRSDVFSLGIVLHELLTGRMLYKDDNLPALLEQVRQANVPPPSIFREAIPDSLDEVVLKAVAREPERRYSSALDMMEALVRVLYDLDPSYSGARLAKLMRDTFPDGPHAEYPDPVVPSVPPPSESATVHHGIPAMRSADFVPADVSVVHSLEGTISEPPPGSGDTIVSDGLPASPLTPSTKRPPRRAGGIVEDTSEARVSYPTRSRDTFVDDEEEEDEATTFFVRPPELGGAELPPAGDRPTAPPPPPSPMARPSPAARPSAPPTRATPVVPPSQEAMVQSGELSEMLNSAEEETVVDSSGDVRGRVEAMLKEADAAAVPAAPARRIQRAPVMHEPTIEVAWEPPPPSWDPLPFVGPPLSADVEDRVAKLDANAPPEGGGKGKWIALALVGLAAAAAAAAVALGLV